MPNESVLIAPSVLSADFTRLGEELESISNADLVHYDVMDGHFVPNLSFGTEILRQAKAATKLPLDVHLMVTNPEEQVPWYLAAGADIVTFHYEAQTHADRLVGLIHDAGAKACVALNPGTPVAALDAILDELDMVLVMKVDGGIGADNVGEVVAAGANVIVAGSKVFKAADHAAAIEELRRNGTMGLAKRA